MTIGIQRFALKLTIALRRRRRLGIGAMLTILLLCVGAFILLTNLIVADVVRIETVTKIIVDPNAIPRPITRASVPTTVEEINDSAKFRGAANQILTTLDRFTSAVRERIVDRTESSEDEFKVAKIALERSAASFSALSTGASVLPAKALHDAVHFHGLRAVRIIAVSDQRRDSRERYASLLESLNARAKLAINGSWKIFGRVVARQSLLQLSADLDSLRRHPPSAKMNADINDRAAVSAQETVNSDLAGNERALRNSQGDQWFENMRTEFTELVHLRAAIVDELDSEKTAIREFSEQAVKLATQVQHVSALSRTSNVVETATITTTANMLKPAKPIIRTSSTTIDPPSGHPNRGLMTWLSIGILTFLTALCVATVVSIVRPVRRLQRATWLLAAGNQVPPLPRERIKEMDSLARSFNLMASEVQQARARTLNYQKSLETEVNERTRQLQILADHDPLTGLPNRRELFAMLNSAIDRARISGCLVGVFFIDVDNFKNINDSVGHAFGDRVLVSLSQRLHTVAQKIGFAARLGGDEFTVVISAAATMDEIRSAGLSMVEAFDEPLVVDGRDLSVSISVGASVFPLHESDSETLLKAADAALFRAKNLGRSQLAVFTPELLEDAAAKFSIEQGLRRAIERGEFELAFQPEVSAESLETVLVEALIRWRMPDGRLAAPAEFLAVAEESGMIVEINDWVLRSAIETAAFWFHGKWPSARVAINVTARQLLDPHFVNTVLELLNRNNVPAACIELELTEAAVQNSPATVDALKSLRSHGIAIALDDFGTGYSSFASIEQLPLTRVKLDRTLIARIDSNSRSAAIAQAIVAMCKELDLEITAEGIERPEQLSMFLGQPAITLQGYLLSRPVSLDELPAELVFAAGRARQLVLECGAGKSGSDGTVEISRYPTKSRLAAP